MLFACVLHGPQVCIQQFPLIQPRTPAWEAGGTKDQEGSQVGGKQLLKPVQSDWESH